MNLVTRGRTHAGPARYVVGGERRSWRRAYGGFRVRRVSHCTSDERRRTWRVLRARRRAAAHIARRTSVAGRGGCCGLADVRLPRSSEHFACRPRSGRLEPTPYRVVGPGFGSRRRAGSALRLQWCTGSAGFTLHVGRASPGVAGVTGSPTCGCSHCTSDERRRAWRVLLARRRAAAALVGTCRVPAAKRPAGANPVPRWRPGAGGLGASLPTRRGLPRVPAGLRRLRTSPGRCRHRPGRRSRARRRGPTR